MGQFTARIERHVERFKDEIQLRRADLGSAAAAIMNTGMVHKPDGTIWMPWDVFPELQPQIEDDNTDVQGIQIMFREMAARQRERMKDN